MLRCVRAASRGARQCLDIQMRQICGHPQHPHLDLRQCLNAGVALSPRPDISGGIPPLFVCASLRGLSAPQEPLTQVAHHIPVQGRRWSSTDSKPGEAQRGTHGTPNGGTEQKETAEEKREGPGGGEGETGKEEDSEPGDSPLSHPLVKEIADLKERLLLSYADMENLRVRMRRENELVKQFAVQEFAKGLLDVADNLSRASAAASSPLPKNERGVEEMTAELAQKRLQSLLEGVEMTEKQLLQVFKKHGLEKFSPVGQKFDPNFHEAMFELEQPDKEPGTVAHVLKDGYSIHGRVLRAAEVGVVKEPVP